MRCRSGSARWETQMSVNPESVPWLSNEATFPVKETRPNGDASDRGKVRVEMAGLESVKPGELEAGQMALEPVREVIETTRSKALERVTDGGDQERQLAQRSPVAPTSH